MAQRTLKAIASEIRSDWKPMSEYAKDHVDGMAECVSLQSRWGVETGADAVRGFLSNAQSWNGETARRVKAELRAMLKAAD